MQARAGFGYRDSSRAIKAVAILGSAGAFGMTIRQGVFLCDSLALCAMSHSGMTLWFSMAPYPELRL